MDFREYVKGEIADTVFQVHNQVYQTGIPHKGFRYEIVRKDGVKRIIENSISLMRDSDNHPHWVPKYCP